MWRLSRRPSKMHPVTQAILWCAAGTIIWAEPNMAMAHPVDYNITQDTAAIHFSTSVAKMITLKGTFTRFKGSIHLDSAHPASTQIDVVIDDDMITAPFDGAQILRSTAYFDQQEWPAGYFVPA